MPQAARRWRHELDLSAFWDGEEHNDDNTEWGNVNAHEVGKLVAQKMKPLDRHFKEDYSWDEMQSNFECINTIEDWKELLDDDHSWVDTPPLEEFNNHMKTLYDFCDAYRIWVKTT